MNQILKLTRNCLSYDFIGTSMDESTDDMSTVQIPTNWRPAFLDINTSKLFFDLYHVLPARLSSLALATLVQITSVRRSLLTNVEREKFLSHLVKGIKSILDNPAGLSDPANFHEFCRLLARLKTNFQLVELVYVDVYPETIALITKFTVQSLQMWQFTPNSVHYLLSLWQRMVASVQFFRDPKPHLLETYTPEVTAAYIKSRLDSAPIILRDGLEDPLDDLGMVSQQLEQLCVIMRCDYEKTVTLLVGLFDLVIYKATPCYRCGDLISINCSYSQTASQYQEALASPNPNSMDMAIHESKLTWLVYIIGSAIGGRLTVSMYDEHDIMDGELVVRVSRLRLIAEHNNKIIFAHSLNGQVLQLMNLTDTRLAQTGCEKIELAILNFLDHVRRIYLIEHMQKMKIYKRLSELLGIADEPMLLSVVNRKM